MFLNTRAIHTGQQRQLIGKNPRPTPRSPLCKALSAGWEPEFMAASAHEAMSVALYAATHNKDLFKALS